MKLSFIVPGKPVAKQRARHFIRGSHVGTYTPPETRMYENMVSMVARDAMKTAAAISGSGEIKMASGAIRLSIASYFPIADTRKKKITEGQPHTQRPDADNLLKAIADGCNGVVWNDDCAVYEKHVVKRWTHQQPRCEVTVEVDE